MGVNRNFGILRHNLDPPPEVVIPVFGEVSLWIGDAREVVVGVIIVLGNDLSGLGHGLPTSQVIIGIAGVVILGIFHVGPVAEAIIGVFGVIGVERSTELFKGVPLFGPDLVVSAVKGIIGTPSPCKNYGNNDHAR